ncbi:MAG: hypothetical protein H6597_05050 [Flavobacteriales bacterium]|nr:hypothetical protein [Flavobacteriales bacterium]MCB9193881.1 hypothetical protein [Flavobacteriales bacterium]
MYRAVLFLSILLLPGALSAQVDDTLRPLEPFQGAWGAAPGIKMEMVATSGDRSGSVEEENTVMLDELRAFRCEALARGHGSLSTADRNAMERMANAISRSDPDSFEAHLAAFHAGSPSDAAFRELEQAMKSGPDRPELLGPGLLAAERSGDAAAVRQAALALDRSGHIAPGLMQVARDLLTSLDRDAVVVLAGEMDVYPTLVLQARSLRPDVLVIDERLLGSADYRARIFHEGGGRGSVPKEIVAFIRALAGSSARPVQMGLGLGHGRADMLANEIYLTGLAYRVGTPPPDAMQVLGERWSTFDPTPEAGPLSWSYLLPGGVLLRHYRASNDEAHAGPLELQLRELAQRIGATNDLYRTGVLLH